MVIFVLALLNFCYKPGYRPDLSGRKVRTAQSNAPVNSRVVDVYGQQTDSATENNLSPNPLSTWWREGARCERVKT